MITSNRLLYLSFLLLLLTACEPEIAAPSEVERSSPVTSLVTDIKYTDTVELRTISFETGERPIGEDRNHLFTGANYLIGELGATLIIAGGQSLYYLKNQYVLQFWSDLLPGNQAWTAAELVDYFEPGKVFPFGEGVGKVDVGVHLPRRVPGDLKLSKASYLENPSGELIVETIEDYEYFLYGLYPSTLKSYGKLISCSFSGTVGRYDNIADEADGNNDYFETDEVVELLNGKVTFYVEYERI